MGRERRGEKGRLKRIVRRRMGLEKRGEKRRLKKKRKALKQNKKK